MTDPLAPPLGPDSSCPELVEALLAIDQVRARDVLRSRLDSGADPTSVADSCITRALETIGAEWEGGRLALSQVYMAGRITEALVEELFPAPAELRPEGPVLALALLEDYHGMGKRLVQLVLRSSGYASEDLGRVTAEELAAKVLAGRYDLLLISTLMLRSALRVREVVDRLRGARSTVPVIVGGAPFRFDTNLWREVGADGCGADASDVLRLVAQFTGKRP